MRDARRPDGQNRSLWLEDFQWGKVEGDTQVGIWPARASVDPGHKAEIRAAVRNLSGHPIELGNDFGLALKHGQEFKEYRGGPRPSQPTVLQPGEFRELLGWSLGEESGLKAGVNTCWVIYRPAGGMAIESAVAEIEVRPIF